MKEELKNLKFRFRIKGKKKGFKYLSDDFTNVSESDVDEIKFSIELANNCEGVRVDEGEGFRL